MRLHRYCYLILFLATSDAAVSQPFLDVVNARYQKSLENGLLSTQGEKNKFDYFNISLNIPYQFKKDSAIFVFSPFIDGWNIYVDGTNNFPLKVRSIALPVTFIKPLNEKLRLSLTFIPRFNGYYNTLSTDDFQAGAAVIINHKKNDRLVYKYGLYFNNEFSGPFFMPLLGIDWNIDDKNNLFGVLPGNLVFEHKLNNKFYCGVWFRAVTNTYNTKMPTYVRVDENQLSLFSDFYVVKKVVLNFEVGHSVLRKMRLGIRDASPKYFYKDNIRDGIVFKTSMAYRLRFR